MRRFVFAVCLCALVTAIASPAFGQNASQIDRIAPSSAKPQEHVTIHGRGFGGRNVKVTVGGVTAEIVSATGSQVTFKVPSNAPTGTVTVAAKNPGGHTGSIAFTVLTEFTGTITLEPDTAAAVTAQVGSDGAVLTTTKDGARIQLSIPPGALVRPQQITLTPITSVGDLPITQLLGAVHLAPEGQMFRSPLTLTITLPAAVNPADVIGFGYEGDGTNTHLEAVSISGNVLSMRIVHFSGGGVATATPAQQNAIANAPKTTLEPAYLNLLNIERWNVIVSVCGGSCDDTAEVDAALAALAPLARPILLQWRAEVDVAIAASHASDERLRLAAIEYNAWRSATENETWGMCLGADRGECAELIATGDAALGAAYVAGLERARAGCNDQRVFELIGEIELLVLNGKGGIPADIQAITTQFGCAMVITLDGLPAEIQKEDVVNVTLRVQQLSPTGALTPIPGALANLTAVGTNCGARLDGRDELTRTTDDFGQSAFQFTAPAVTACGPTTGILVSIGTVFGQDGSIVALGKDKSFTTTIVEPRVVLMPAHIELDPGGSQRFLALDANGDPIAAEFFSDAGGSFSDGSLYTAGTQLGTFRVTARSLSNPGDFGFATVVIRKKITVAVSPKGGRIATGRSKQFTATLTNASNPEVTWSVTGASTISSTGLFHAGPNPEIVTVRATSVEDPTKSASVQVTVVRPYAVTQIIAGSENFFPIAMNDDLIVAGDMRLQDGRYHAARWQGATLIDLGTLGGTSSHVSSLNADGTIVGTAQGPGLRPLGARTLAFRSPSGGTMINIDDDVRSLLGDCGSGNPCSQPHDINDHGLITGYMSSAEPFQSASFLLRDGAVRRFTAPEGFDHCTPYGLNNHGHAVGLCGGVIDEAPGFRIEGFLWKDANENGNTESSEFEMLRDFFPVSINDRGDMFSYSRGQIRTFDGTIVGVPFFIRSKMNNSGQAVGSGASWFLWDDGVITDIKDLLPGGSSLIGAAPGTILINNRGDIVVQNGITGDVFLLSPGSN